MENRALSKRNPGVYGAWTSLALFPFFGLIQGAQHGVEAGMWVVMTFFPSGSWYGTAAIATKVAFMCGGVFMAVVLLTAGCITAWWVAGYCMARLTVQRGVKEASYAEVD